MAHATLPPPPEATGPGQPTTTSSGRPRVAALDVLRGFALCGILLANVKPIAHMVDAAPVTHPVVAATQDGAWLGLLVDQRFFPIFSLLFGIGFSLLLDSAGRHVLHPRVLMLRRLLVLLPLGLAHMFLLWRGDIPTIYAVVGLLVLLPSTWLPRWAVAGLAAVLIATPLILGSNGVPLVPLWLRRYRQGPLEWLWRWATWAHRPPLRRTPSGARPGGSQRKLSEARSI
ncbi:DUF418 domain-containing protein [Sphaerisporangium sp. NPDC049002]|uniref:DUF418 domain-containing protein n=1 Tax=Sphaerisporangium sp. NPDC049002 TaxID=3155392 RepID=UPI00340B3767